MIAGHFAVGLALKARYHNVPLWALLVAVQLCDWVWLVLSALKVEHFRLYLTLSGALRLDAYDIVYSHSLFWIAMYALLTFLVFVRAEHERHWAVPLALAICSHWILDWLVCAPILPFGNWGPPLKFGAGLGELFPFSGLLVESLVVAGGWWVYNRYSEKISLGRAWPILAVLLILLFAPEILARVF